MRTKYTTTGGKGHQYVGVRVEDGVYERFQAWGTPVRETHGKQYAAVIGPFKTVRGARFMADYGKGNPHCQHVDDAERIARDFAENDYQVKGS